MLDGAVYDSVEAKAINFKNNFIDVMSASWGPKDDGMTIEGPGAATQEALEMGVRKVNTRQALTEYKRGMSNSIIKHAKSLVSITVIVHQVIIIICMHEW